MPPASCYSCSLYFCPPGLQRGKIASEHFGKPLGENIVWEFKKPSLVIFCRPEDWMFLSKAGYVPSHAHNGKTMGDTCTDSLPHVPRQPLCCHPLWSSALSVASKILKCWSLKVISPTFLNAEMRTRRLRQGHDLTKFHTYLLQQSDSLIITK